MSEVNPVFKYKIIWRHDGKEEILYAITHEDVQKIKESILNGSYTDNHVEIEKIGKE